ncbi:MAG: hypothetical protein CR972_04285 [Candidatus Moraniibacteriota bacterium]|nr:MAG: hypothetical protein CR972_04285 [Candidatus Moranbacteria bacterium]
MKTPITRRIFFWTLTISYFITTAAVLFFVFGYKHDFSSKIFIHTGSISIAPNPQKNINILINDKKPQSRLVNFINNSYYISGLHPRNYEITVQKNGFKPWKKEISVHSGVSTEFWNITLVRNKYEHMLYNLENIDQFFPAPKENIFAATRQLGKTLSIHVFDTENNTSTNTFLFPKKEFTKDVRENIEWAPNSKDLIIPLNTTETTKKDYAIAYTKNDLHILLSDHISLPMIHNVRWDPKDENTIYLISNTSLFRTEINPEEKTIILDSVANDVIAYDFTDDGIYLFTTDYRILYDHNVHGTNFKEITSFELPKNTRDVRLIAYDNHRFSIINDEERTLYLYNKGDKSIYIKKFDTNIIGAHFSDDGKKLLFYSPFEIFVYFARNWDAQPIRKENEMHSIIRFSQPLDNVHFAKDYEHVMYTVGNEIKMTELDYRGNRVTETIMQTSEKNNTLINKHKKNFLYFIESEKGHTRQLRSIKFPEKETFF